MESVLKMAVAVGVKRSVSKSSNLMNLFCLLPDTVSCYSNEAAGNDNSEVLLSVFNVVTPL